MAKVDKATMDKLMRYDVVPEPSLPKLEALIKAGATKGCRVAIDVPPSEDGEAIYVRAQVSKEGRQFIESHADPAVALAYALSRCLEETTPVQGAITWEVGPDGVKLEPAPPPTWQGSRHNADPGDGAEELDPEELDDDDGDADAIERLRAAAAIREAEATANAATPDGAEDEGEGPE